MESGTDTGNQNRDYENDENVMWHEKGKACNNFRVKAIERTKMIRIPDTTNLIKL